MTEIEQNTYNFANLEGEFNLQFWGKTHKDLIPTKDYPGGKLSFTPTSFTYDAPVYARTVDAYENTAGNWLSQWQIPLTDLDSLLSLGVVSYTNDKVEDDFGRSQANHGANFKITITDPIEATWDSNFYIDITNRREEPETIKMGFRGGDPKRHQLDIITTTDKGSPIHGSPIYVDFLGMRPVGASEDTPLQYSWDVEDNTTIELELFARVYTVSEPIFKNSVTVTKYTEQQLRDLGYQPGATTRGEKAYAFAELDPNFNLTIEQAAELAGYDHFNWYQVITSDTEDKLKNQYEKQGYNVDYPLTDPPGGATFGKGKSVDYYPYYLDENNSFTGYYDNPKFNVNGNFNFRDRPTVKRSLSGSGLVEFKTYLVGVSKENNCLSEALFNFEWSSNCSDPK